MPRIKAVKQPDLVLISWSRNALRPGSARRIESSRVIGSSYPCQVSIKSGMLLSTALACLRDADVGFRVVYSKQTSSISGYLLLQRF